MGTVLVIEDEKGILGLIEAALVRSGHDVETALDGREGIAKFDRGAFDVVITDCVMPEAGGADVLYHIRRSTRRLVPIIGMSGTPWMLQGTGFDAVLLKPFPLSRLLEVVRSVSAGSPSKAAA
jgi:DNA-binding response OmpR family regulator